MDRSSIVRGVLFCGIVMWQYAAVSAQQFSVTAPFNQTSSGFFEQSGVGFGISGPNFFFQQSSFGQALPQFGGFNPSSAANMGYSLHGGGWNANFNFAFGQGAQTSSVSSAPTVTMTNGVMGGMFAGQWTPFVIGAIPVVNDAAPGLGVPFGPMGSSSLLEERLSRLNAGESAIGSSNSATRSAAHGGAAGGSSHSAVDVPVSPDLDPFQQKLARASAADVGLPSVAEIERRHRAEAQAATAAQNAEVDELEARGDAALQAGKPGVARVYYRQAAARATGLRQQTLQTKANQL
jgi:hypothetical protein